MNLFDKWRIKASISVRNFKLANSVQGWTKDDTLPIYAAVYIKLPDHVVIIRPDLESLRN